MGFIRDAWDNIVENAGTILLTVIILTALNWCIYLKYQERKPKEYIEYKDQQYDKYNKIQDRTIIIIDDDGCFHLRNCSKFAIVQWIEIRDLKHIDDCSWCSNCVDYDLYKQIETVWNSCQDSKFEVSMSEDSIF